MEFGFHGETFACSRQDVKNVFASDDLTWASFGSPIHSSSTAVHRHGSSDRLLRLQISRDQEAHLCVYRSPGQYPDLQRMKCALDLPILCEWLRTKKSQPAATLGHYEIIAEWIDRSIGVTSSGFCENAVEQAPDGAAWAFGVTRKCRERRRW